MIVVLAPKVLASLPIKAATPKLQIIDKLPPATRTLAYITQRLQPRTAFLAVIEELASIGRQTSAVSPLRRTWRASLCKRQIDFAR